MLKGVVFVHRTEMLDEEVCATAWLGSYEANVSALAESMMQIAFTVVDTLKFMFVFAAFASDSMVADSNAVAAAFIANRKLLFIVNLQCIMSSDLCCIERYAPGHPANCCLCWSLGRILLIATAERLGLSCYGPGQFCSGYAERETCHNFTTGARQATEVEDVGGIGAQRNRCAAMKTGRGGCAPGEN
jgi:hypothetical protein